jgi:hypothetical protein
MAKPKPPKAIYVPVDAWTLRCLFNRSDYGKRLASNELVELMREHGKWRNGVRTVQVYYGLEDDGVKVLFVTLQWFENEHSEILRSGFKDPKQFYVDGADYHLHGGSRWWERFRREPQVILGEANAATAWGRCVIAVQKRYAAWRRYKCQKWGPVEAVRQLSRLSGRAALVAGPS